MKEKNELLKTNKRIKYFLVLFSLIILAINIAGTLSWIKIYEIYPEWWVITLSVICGITSIIWGIKLGIEIRKLLRKNDKPSN